ncbi:MAG TPA: hypothetical protein VGV86_04945 [Acidimicrobiales bacterium]|nr:hypothetical protein [Acidimicrobiales bacterium]
MINPRDPLDRLRAVNPVLLTDVTLSPPDPVLFRRITSAGAVGVRGDLRQPDRRRRRARRMAPVLVLSSLLGGAVAYGLLRGEVTKPENVACYESADLDAKTAVVSVDEEGPLAACAELWRRGALGTAGQVPDLVECVLGSGVAGVFPTMPGQDVCRTLELSSVTTTTGVPGTAPQPPPDPGAGLRAFRDAVAGPFLDSPCLEAPLAASIVRRELDRAGLTDWTIRGGDGLSGDGFTAQRPCATISLRPENKEVVLVPTPRR